MRPPDRVLDLGLAAFATVAFVLIALLVVRSQAVAGGLGGDFLAYDAAARRLVAGADLYDQSATQFGAPNAFFYPPPFALLLAPVALVPSGVALEVWILGLIIATVIAILVMPVSLRIRSVVMLLASVSWPVLYAIKLGQVGPFVLLLFAVGWRSLARQTGLGLTIALGAIGKVQPVVLVSWAALTGRLRAATVSVAVLIAVSALATVVAGPQAWRDWFTVLARASASPATHDVAISRLALDAGASASVVDGLVALNFALVVLTCVVAVRVATAEASYLTFVTASQLLSTVLWDHYALVLLLPVAWLVSQGRLWTALIPLASSTLLLGITPVAVYPLAFWVTLVAVVRVGMHSAATVRA